MSIAMFRSLLQQPLERYRLLRYRLLRYRLLRYRLLMVLLASQFVAESSRQFVLLGFHCLC